MKGKAWWVTLVVAGALAATAGFLRASADRPGRPGVPHGSLPDEPPTIRGVITQVEPLAAQGSQAPRGTPPPNREGPAGRTTGPAAAGNNPDEPVTASPESPGSSGTGETGGIPAAAGRWRILVEEHRAPGNSAAGNSDNPANSAGSTQSPLPIWLTVDDRTQVGASVGRHFFPLPAEGALQPGQSVRAWIRGGIRESYPAQADAATVLVEPYLARL